MSARFLPSLLAITAMLSPALADPYRQTIGIGALDILSIKVSATMATASDPSLAPRSNRDYIDGFNRVDSSGNLGEGAPGLASRTGNFGFTSDAQVDLSRGTLALHTLNPGEGKYFDRSSRRGDIAPELQYRILRERSGSAAFGLEARAGRIDFDYSNSGPLAGTVRVLTDTYALGGVVPQPAPYMGAFNVQPGTQRIGDTPSRTIASAPATVQGERTFTAKGWLLRAGFVWQPLDTSRVALQIHGGPALMNLKGTFRLNERWVTPGVPALTQTAEGSHREWLLGAYAGATVDVHLSARWNVFAGADVLHADTLSLPAAAGRAQFDFSRAILINAGLAFRF